MKAVFTIAAAVVAAPLAAQGAASLPGVADEETTIPSGGINQFHAGKGDVLFVLDRAGRWYRVGLNEGCLHPTLGIDSLAFGNAFGSERIDRFTHVRIERKDSLVRSCRIDSIRRSEAPPQLNSQSRVTLD